MNKNICVITADLYKSREIINRKKVQEKLKTVIEKVNRKYKDYILSNFMITLGDEWQGSLKNIEKSYEIINEFQSELFPIKISFGIGEGNVSTKISKKVTEMDGKAFINSRESLEKSKKEKINITFIIKDKEKEKTLNIILELIQAIKENWTVKQFEKIRLYKELKTVRKVGESLGTYHSNIVESLNSAKYYEVTRAEKLINSILLDMVTKKTDQDKWSLKKPTKTKCNQKRLQNKLCI